MSFIDFEPKLQQRPYDLWENPHPQGFIAMLKRSLNMIPDLVNGSIAATGAPPSTEEEAFLYNLARERGIAGAFGAASNFGPAAPQFVRVARDAASRAVPQALEGSAPRQLNGVNTSNMRAPNRLRPISSGSPLPGGSVPSVPPPAAGSAPSEGLLARLRELDAPGVVPELPAPARDPNFRQLSRFPILPTLEAVGAGATHLLDIPDFLRRVPDPQAQDPVVAERTDGPPNTSSGGSRDVVGGKGGGSGGGDGGGDGRGSDRSGRNYKDDCDDELAEELRSCESYKGRAAHRDYYHGCVERAKGRWIQCYKNGAPNLNGPGRWRPGTDERPGDEETWINHRRRPGSMRK